MEISKVDITKYIKSLKDISFDDKNSITVCNYSNKFIDFDELKKIKSYKKLPLSSDMIYINDNFKEIWFVEFKSSKKESLYKSRFKLKRKLLDSLIIFYEIFQSYYDYKKFFFLIYNREESYEDILLNDLSNKDIEFGLEEFEGMFIEKVFTDSCENFIKYWSDRFNIKFSNQEL